MKKFLLTLVLMTLISPVIASDNVTLIGLDETGEEISIPMKSKKWSKRVTKVLNKVGGDVLPMIKNQYGTNQQFEFRQFDIGLAVPMKVGIGELVKATIKPYFELYFKK